MLLHSTRKRKSDNNWLSRKALLTTQRICGEWALVYHIIVCFSNRAPFIHIDIALHTTYFVTNTRPNHSTCIPTLGTEILYLNSYIFIRIYSLRNKYPINMDLCVCVCVWYPYTHKWIVHIIGVANKLLSFTLSFSLSISLLKNPFHNLLQNRSSSKQLQHMHEDKTECI